jgi:hypothetical protein
VSYAIHGYCHRTKSIVPYSCTFTWGHILNRSLRYNMIKSTKEKYIWIKLLRLWCTLCTNHIVNFACYTRFCVGVVSISFVKKISSYSAIHKNHNFGMHRRKKPEPMTVNCSLVRSHAHTMPTHLSGSYIFRGRLFFMLLFLLQENSHPVYQSESHQHYCGSIVNRYLACVYTTCSPS